MAKAFKKNYSRKLKFPKTLVADPCTEFFGSVEKLMKQHNIYIRRSEANNNRAQAFVERANRTNAEKLFSHQYSQELLIKERSRVWVKRLPAIMKTLNKTPTRLTGKEPIKALKLDRVDIKETNYKQAVGSDEPRLPMSVYVRYLLADGELEGGRKRATDPFWSLDVF